jgi:hypothetical protein
MEKVVLKNISKQLCLRFDEHLPAKAFHRHFSHLHALKLEYVKQIPLEVIQHVSVLSLFSCFFPSSTSWQHQKWILSAKMLCLDSIEEVVDFEKIQFPNIVKLCLYEVEVLHFYQLNDYPALLDLYLREVHPNDNEMIHCSRIQSIDVDGSYFLCLACVTEIRDVSFSGLQEDLMEPDEALELALTHFDSIERLFLAEAVFECLEADSLISSLISLSFKSCEFLDGSFDTCSFPSLVELFMEGCTDLEKLT